MRLCAVCTACREDIIIKSWASDRPELQKEQGDNLNLNCLKCGNMARVHVNDIKAKTSVLKMLTGIGVALVTTVILWRYFGAISTVTGLIPIMFWEQEKREIKAFNSYSIKRK